MLICLCVDIFRHLSDVEHDILYLIDILFSLVDYCVKVVSLAYQLITIRKYLIKLTADLLDLNLLLLLKSECFVVLEATRHRRVTVGSGIHKFLLLLHDFTGSLTEPLNQRVQLALESLFLFFLDSLKSKLDIRVVQLI